MNRKTRLFLAGCAIFAIATCGGFAQATKTLEVQITYSGVGSVDSQNQIHLYLFDTPDISGGSMPIAWNSTSENGGKVKFSGLTARKVYLVVAYGNYDPTMGPPPSGTPVSFYMPGDPVPTAVELNEAVEQISFRFDDSARMP